MPGSASPASVTATPSPTVWPLQRILFLLAGTVTLTGVVLAVSVSPWFLLLPAVAGANQLLMVATGWCPMSLLLTRLGVQPSCR
jgi:hypothetical protein